MPDVFDQVADAPPAPPPPAPPAVAAPPQAAPASAASPAGDVFDSVAAAGAGTDVFDQAYGNLPVSMRPPVTPEDYRQRVSDPTLTYTYHHRAGFGWGFADTDTPMTFQQLYDNAVPIEDKQRATIAQNVATRALKMGDPNARDLQFQADKLASDLTRQYVQQSDPTVFPEDEAQLRSQIATQFQSQPLTGQAVTAIDQGVEGVGHNFSQAFGLQGAANALRGLSPAESNRQAIIDSVRQQVEQQVNPTTAAMARVAGNVVAPENLIAGETAAGVAPSIEAATASPAITHAVTHGIQATAQSASLAGTENRLPTPEEIATNAVGGLVAGAAAHKISQALPFAQRASEAAVAGDLPGYALNKAGDLTTSSVTSAAAMAATNAAAAAAQGKDYSAQDAARDFEIGLALEPIGRLHARASAAARGDYTGPLAQFPDETTARQFVADNPATTYVPLQAHDGSTVHAVMPAAEGERTPERIQESAQQVARAQQAFRTQTGDAGLQLTPAAPPDSSDFTRTLGDRLGLQVHWYASNRPLEAGMPSAVYLGDGHVAVNVDANGGGRDPLGDVPHEFVHDLRQTQPAVYDDLAALAQRVAPNRFAQARQEYADRFAAGIGRSLPPEVADEEGVADFVKSMMTTPQKWNYLVRRQPTFADRLGAFVRDRLGVAPYAATHASRVADAGERLNTLAQGESDVAAQQSSPAAQAAPSPVAPVPSPASATGPAPVPGGDDADGVPASPQAGPGDGNLRQRAQQSTEPPVAPKPSPKQWTADRIERSLTRAYEDQTGDRGNDEDVVLHPDQLDTLSPREKAKVSKYADEDAWTNRTADMNVRQADTFSRNMLVRALGNSSRGHLDDAMAWAREHEDPAIQFAAWMHENRTGTKKQLIDLSSPEKIEEMLGKTFTINKEPFRIQVDENGIVHLVDSDVEFPGADRIGDGHVPIDAGSERDLVGSGAVRNEDLPFSLFKKNRDDGRDGQLSLAGETGGRETIGGTRPLFERKEPAQREITKLSYSHNLPPRETLAKFKISPADVDAARAYTDGDPSAAFAYGSQRARAGLGMKAVDGMTGAEAREAHAGWKATKEGMSDISRQVADNPMGLPPTELAERTRIQGKQVGETGALFSLASGDTDAARKAWEEKGTDSPYFKRWFGESKVVDGAGKPLVVYHGTTGDIGSFDPSRRGENTGAESARNGFFFTDDTRTAESYANHAATDAKIHSLLKEAEAAGAKGDWDTHDAKIEEYEALDASFRDPKNRSNGQNVVPAYLSLKNPLKVDARGENAQGFDIPQAIRQATKGGHDGVIISNLDDAAGLVDRNATHYIAFSPEQIKSATGNRGTFDAADPDIRFSTATKDETEKQPLVRRFAATTRAMVQDVRDGMNLDPVPRLSRLGGGDEAASHAFARPAAGYIVKDVLAKVFPDQYRDPIAMTRTWEALNDDRKLGIYDDFKDRAAAKRSEAEALQQQPTTIKGVNDDQVKNLLRSADDYADKANAIDLKHNVARMEAHWQAAMKDPTIADNVARWNEHGAPLMDQLYNEGKGLDPDAPQSPRGRHSAGVSLVSTDHDLFDYGMGQLGTTGDELPADKPLAGGTMHNAKVSKDRWDQAASGLGDYETNPEVVLNKIVGSRWNQVTKLRLFDRLQKSGLGVINDVPPHVVENGQRVQYRRLDITQPRTEENGFTHMVPKTMWIRPEVYREVRDVLNTDLAPPSSPVFRALTRLQLLQLADAITHTKNLHSVLAGSLGGGSVWRDLARKVPGLATGDAVQEWVRTWRDMVNDTPEIRAEMAAMAKAGNLRPDFPATGIQKITKMQDFLHAADTAGRVILNRRFDTLVSRGVAEDTPGNRRNFIAQLGNYNRRLMNPMARVFKDLGLSPFVTAGTTFNRQARRLVAGDPGFKSASFGAAARARAMNLGGVALAMALLPGLVNTATTGSPMGRSGTPLGAIDTGTDDDQGKHRIFDYLQLMGMRRGLKSVGIDALANGLAQGKDWNTIAGNAVSDVSQSALHPWLGPGLGFAAAAFTGRRLDLRGTMNAQKIPEGGWKQNVENFRAAVASQNPLLYAAGRAAVSGADKLAGGTGDGQSTGADLEDVGSTLLKSPLGAFGVKSVSPGTDAAQDMAARLSASRFPDTGPNDPAGAKAAAVRNLAASLRAGDADAMDRVQQSIADGTISEKDVPRIIDRSGMTDLEWKISHMSGAEAAKVYAAGTDQEQSDMRAAVIDRIAKDNTLSSEDRMSLLQKLGGPEGGGAGQAEVKLVSELADLRSADRADKALKQRIAALGGQIGQASASGDGGRAQQLRQQRQSLVKAAHGSHVNGGRLKLLSALSGRVSKIRKQVASGSLSRAVGGRKIRQTFAAMG